MWWGHLSWFSYICPPMTGREEGCKLCNMFSDTGANPLLWGLYLQDPTIYQMWQLQYYHMGDGISACMWEEAEGTYTFHSYQMANTLHLLAFTKIQQVLCVNMGLEGRKLGFAVQLWHWVCDSRHYLPSLYLSLVYNNSPWFQGIRTIKWMIASQLQRTAPDIS